MILGIFLGIFSDFYGIFRIFLGALMIRVQTPPKKVFWSGFGGFPSQEVDP